MSDSELSRTAPTVSQTGGRRSSADATGAPAAAPPERVCIEPGDAVGPYRVLRKLGAGGFGQVYEAVEMNVGKRVAIKVLRPDRPPSQTAMQRLLNEARTVNLIGHPGLVDAHAAGTLEDGLPYIVMEFLNGQSLGERLRSGPMTPAALLPIALQLARALAAAHRKGVTHRDLKPENVMLVPDAEVAGSEHAKIIDFGIAKLTEGSGMSALIDTATGAILGSLPYMSPEQCRDSVQVDAATDVYALGVIFYQALSGRRPFDSRQPDALRLLHQHATVPPLAELAPELPRRLCLLVHRMLEKAPALRPTLAQVQAELEALAGAPNRRQRQVRTLTAATVGAALAWFFHQKPVAEATHSPPAAPAPTAPRVSAPAAAAVVAPSVAQSLRTLEPDAAQPASRSPMRPKPPSGGASAKRRMSAADAQDRPIEAWLRQQAR